ncbi:hypothetical protein BH09SUM1_BH09SUM1_25030 [soil metagenome]
MLAKFRSCSIVVLMLCLAFTFAGCKKYRAENSLKKTQQIISNIEQNYNGLVHEPERITALKKKLDEARAGLDTDPGTALTLASQARTEADLILESVRPKHASALLSQAREELRVGQVNDLIHKDPDRYNRIQQIMEEADKANSANKWDDVISASKELIQEVATGLQPVKNDADRKAADAAEALTELRQIGGPKYTPEVVIGVQDDINTAQRIYDKDRDYQLAANKFQEATTKAETGIVQVQREKSREGLEKIEGYLSTALLEGAEIFKPKEYADAVHLFTSLSQTYIEGKYSTVLEGTEDLEPKAQRLVIETKRTASDERIANLDKSIRDLEEGGILEYVPGSLDKLKTFLTQVVEVRKADDEPAFDKIKLLGIEAADETDKVRSAFYEVADDRGREAKAALEKARAVFDQMATIFLPLPGPMTSEEQVFESQKSARQEQLRKDLDEATIRLTVADTRKSEDKFKGSILAAEDVSRMSAQILAETFHVVAHNASIELAKLISRYERDGARQYAPDELARSSKKLEEVKGLIASGQYEKSVQSAAEARADVELMAQRIAGRATEDLRDARRALDSATSEKTRKYRGEMLKEVAKLIDQAEVDLTADRLKLALENANKATLLAKQADTESNQISAKEHIELANVSILQAQDAGAELYAGREIEESRKLLGSARVLYDSQDYVKAEELAVSAVDRARGGLFKKIDEAETEIATANSVGGWAFDDARLASANTQVREARAQLEKKNYAASRSLAESAAATARSLANDAKQHNFDDRVARIRKNLDSGQKQGINFFQPEDSIAIRKRLAELENEFTLDKYELVMTEVEKLEGQLRGTLDSTDEMVKTVAQQQSGRLDHLEADGATAYAAAEVADARASLKFALLDYDRGLYKSAHSNLSRAISVIDTVEARRAQERYSREIDNIFADYKAAQLAFANILTLQPSELKDLAIGPNGAAQAVAISAQITPNQFRERLDTLYQRALVVKTPQAMTPVQNSVIQAMSEGRIAAMNFEKLAILNQVATREAMLLIDQAYIRLNNSNRIVANVQNQLTSDQVRFRLVNSQASSIVKQQ